MAFDLCQHEKTQLILKAGAVIRSLKGLPEEKNVSDLYVETCLLLGIVPKKVNSRNTDHLPSPQEMKDKDGKFVVPRKDCPGCNGKEIVVLAPLCQSCADAEGGKYKSVWSCLQCGWKEKLQEPFMKALVNTWRERGLSEEEISERLPSGDKRVLGIKTLTDKGLE